MNEFQMMKEQPQALFDYYLSLMQAGTPLDDSQLIKFEYLKKVLIYDAGV
jgi:hypothetical protein